MEHFSFKRSSSYFRKVPLAAESLLSSSGTSPVSSVTSPLLSSPSNSLSYTATFSQSASMAGVFSIRDAAQPIGQVSTPGKARNGTHKASRPSKDIEDSVGSKKRKNSPYSSSTSFPPSSSSSSLFPTVDNHKRNGSSYHPILQSSGGISATTPARKKGLGRGGSTLWSSRDDWLSRAEGSQSHSSQNRWGQGCLKFRHLYEFVISPELFLNIYLCMQA